MPNLGAAPHDWGFAKKRRETQKMCSLCLRYCRTHALQEWKKEGNEDVLSLFEILQDTHIAGIEERRETQKMCFLCLRYCRTHVSQ